LNPVSVEELSVQLRLIWLGETTVALRPVGAAGGVPERINMAPPNCPRTRPGHTATSDIKKNIVGILIDKAPLKYTNDKLRARWLERGLL
jgi:hypothetical protein